MGKVEEKPYDIEERNGEYCVINIDTGANMGCSPTRAEAERHREAIYANENGKRKPKRTVQKETKSTPFYLIKADATLGQVEAIVSVMGIIDLGADIIHNGAYAKTIMERRGKIRVLDNHNTDSTLRAVGYPLEMREVGRGELPPAVLADYPEATGGLYTKTQFLIETPEGLGVFQRIAAGAINEWSIGYDALDTDRSKVIDPQTQQEIVVRNLRTIRLWEYSPVLWGMNQATVTVGAKGEDFMDGKAQSDASNYRTVDATAAARCASCRFYREVNDTQGYCKHFDFIAGQNWVCDSYASGKGQPKPDGKEYIEGEGGQSRLGDYLVAQVYGKFMGICNDCLSSGTMSGTEHQMMCNTGMKVMDTIRAGIPEDLALRPYGNSYGMMDMLFWSAEGSELVKAVEGESSPLGKAQIVYEWYEESVKAGRMLSAKNATKISAAVDSLLEVLIDAGVYTSVEENTPAQDPGESGKSQAGSQSAPTNYETEAMILEGELLALELEGLT